MDFLANPNEVSFRFGDYIEEFQTILAANDIKYGAPDNFATFARRLSSDEVLAADLDRMVRSVILRETGNVSLRIILTIVAIAAGGKTIADPARDIRQPMQVVIDAMIRSGGCSPDDPQHLDTFCRSTPPNPNSIDDPLPQLTDTPIDLNQSLTRLQRNTSDAMQYLDSIEQRITRLEPILEFIPHNKAPSPSRNYAPSPDPTTPPIPSRLKVLLDDSASRLTILFNDSTARVTQFLASQKSNLTNNFPSVFGNTLPRKFNDLQKNLDSTLTTFTDNFFSYSFTDKLRTYRFTNKIRTHPFTDKLLNHSFTQKLLTYPFTDKLFEYRSAATNKFLNHPYTDKLLNHRYAQKLLTYRVSNRLIQRTAAVPLTAAAIVGSSLLYLTIAHKPQALIQPPTTPIAEAPATPPLIAPADHPQLTVYAEPLDKPISRPHKPSAYQEQATTTHPQRQPLPSPTTPKSSTTTAVTPPTPATNTQTEDQATHSGKYALTTLSSWTRPSHAIDVSSGVMASNLVSATPPNYPRLASLFHMRGKVVMQAVIAKNGTVQSLQVLQGHHLLRGAAKDAVHSWRYRPYLIDDKPVEVATIVTVDFNQPN